MTRSTLTFFPDPLGGRPVGGPLLVISQIRGDLAALDEVLDKTGHLDLCGIVAAGDHCLGGPDPFGVYRRLGEVGAALVRGETDDALAVADVPAHVEAEEGYDAYRRTRDQLGDVVCRRLGELPTTQVVTLGGHAGVMVVSGTPKLPHRGVHPRMSDNELDFLCGCAAEDVLVVGKGEGPFVRALGPMLLAHPGAVAGPRASALLVQEFAGGLVGIHTLQVARRRTTRRRAG